MRCVDNGNGMDGQRMDVSLERRRDPYNQQHHDHVVN